MASLEQRSLRSVRLSARAPRWALFAVVGVLCIRGLLETVRPAPASLVAAPVRPATPAVVPVGAPAVAAGVDGEGGQEVSDGRLRVVVRRALTNYLAGARDNLRADLTAEARLAPPPSSLRLTDLTDLRRVGSGAVAATVLAEDRAGAVYTLRYVLAVVRRDRWYVAGLLTEPIAPK